MKPASVRNVKTIVDQHDLIIKRSHLNSVSELEIKKTKHRTESVIYPFRRVTLEGHLWQVKQFINELINIFFFLNFKTAHMGMCCYSQLQEMQVCQQPQSTSE